MMRLGSCCAGIGGLDLGFEQAGWTIAWQIERDEAKRRILDAHWPDVRRWATMDDAPIPALGPVECLAVGIPTWTPDDIPGVMARFFAIADALRPPILLIEMPPEMGATFAPNGDLLAVHEFAKRGYFTTEVNTQVNGGVVSSPYNWKSGWLIGHVVALEPFPDGKRHALLNLQRETATDGQTERNYGAVTLGHADAGEADWGFSPYWTLTQGITAQARCDAILESTHVLSAASLAKQMTEVIVAANTALVMA